MMKVGHFLVLFVVFTTGIPIYLHNSLHGNVSLLCCCLYFFLPLNCLICFWEIGLGLHIGLIKRDYEQLSKKYKSRNFNAVIDFFLAPLSTTSLFSLEFWSRVWSTYSLYDPSYSNRESFGFFVDVGNGWTTIVPSLMFLIGMMVELMDARVLGMIGLAKFYQELYGTCIYFLSFILNKRYVNRSMLEVGLFVGLSNGLWFVFPLIGMWASATLIMTGNYSVFR